MMDENCDLLADSHSILIRWKKNFYRLLNGHNISDVKQMEIHTVEPSRLEVEITNVKLKSNSDQTVTVTDVTVCYP
jgi:DNA-binding protein Fis